MANYTSLDAWIAFRKESAFRCGVGGSIATPTALSDTGYVPLPLDNLEEDLETFEAWLKTEESRVMGSGRNIGKLTNLGYDVPDKELSLKAQLAIWLYYALGGCTTEGTAIPTADESVTATAGALTITTATSYTFAANALKGLPLLIGTDVRYIVSHPACSAAVVVLTLDSALVVDGAQTLKWLGGTSNVATFSANSNNTITYTTASNITVLENALRGMVIKNDFAGTAAYYTIMSHASVSAAKTIVFTVDRPTATHTGKTMTLQTFPFTHTISESNTLPSFILHYENTGGETDIIQNTYGCTVKSLEITMEQGAVVGYKVGVTGAYA